MTNMSDYNSNLIANNEDIINPNKKFRNVSTNDKNNYTFNDHREYILGCNIQMNNFTVGGNITEFKHKSSFFSKYNEYYIITEDDFNKKEMINDENYAVIKDLLINGNLNIFDNETFKYDSLGSCTIMAFNKNQLEITLQFQGFNDNFKYKKDLLDYEIYAKTMANLILKKQINPPMTVGIYAPWGSGKTFLLNTIDNYLKENINNDQDNKYILIHFNAWEFSGCDVLWAGLIKKLYDSLENEIGSFWLRLYLILYPIKQNLWQNILIILSKWLVLILGIILYIYLENQINSIIVLLMSIGVTLSLIGNSLWNSTKDLLLGQANIISNQAKEINNKVGFMNLVRNKVETLCDLLKELNYQPIIFIDDLDRCNHKKAVQVLDATLLLLSTSNSPFFTFLALDPRIIVKAIECTYEESIVKAGISGYEYLDKIVQIPFTIPPLIPDNRKKYMKKFIDAYFPKKKWSLDEYTIPKDGNEKYHVNNQESNNTENNISNEDNIEVTSQEYIETLILGESETELFQKYAEFMDGNTRKINRIFNGYMIARSIAFELNVFQDFNNMYKLILLCTIFAEQWPYKMSLIIYHIETHINNENLQKQNSEIQDLELEDENSNYYSYNDNNSSYLYKNIMHIKSIYEVYQEVKLEMNRYIHDELIELSRSDCRMDAYLLFLDNFKSVTINDFIRIYKNYLFSLNPAIKHSIIKFSKKLDKTQKE